MVTIAAAAGESFIKPLSSFAHKAVNILHIFFIRNTHTRACVCVCAHARVSTPALISVTSRFSIAFLKACSLYKHILRNAILSPLTHTHEHTKEQTHSRNKEHSTAHCLNTQKIRLIKCFHVYGLQENEGQSVG